MPTAWVSSDVMLPLMLAERKPSVRLIVTGPCAISIEAMSPSGASPRGPAIISALIFSTLLMSSERPVSTTSTALPSTATCVTVWPTRNWLT